MGKKKHQIKRQIAELEKQAQLLEEKLLQMEKQSKRLDLTLVLLEIVAAIIGYLLSD